MKQPATSEIRPDGIGISYTPQLRLLVGGIFQVLYIKTGNSANLTSAITAFNRNSSGLVRPATSI
jgi:hypothetical protein